MSNKLIIALLVSVIPLQGLKYKSVNYSHNGLPYEILIGKKVPEIVFICDDSSFDYSYDFKKWEALSTNHAYDTTFVLQNGNSVMKVDTIALESVGARFHIPLYSVLSYDEQAQIAAKCFSSDEMEILGKANAVIQTRFIVNDMGHVEAIKSMLVSGGSSDIKKIPISSLFKFVEALKDGLIYEDAGVMEMLDAKYYVMDDRIDFGFKSSGMIKATSHLHNPLNLETINELEKEGLTVRYKSLFTDR